MQRLRLKADGRIVELRDGQEFPLAPAMASAPRLATRFGGAHAGRKPLGGSRPAPRARA